MEPRILIRVPRYSGCDYPGVCGGSPRSLRGHVARRSCGLVQIGASRARRDRYFGTAPAAAQCSHAMVAKFEEARSARRGRRQEIVAPLASKSTGTVLVERKHVRRR